MNKYPETKEWMEYAIRRTNQIREGNDVYQFDTQRLQIYHDELEKTLNDVQKELLHEYQEHALMREDELALAVFIAGFEDACRILKNVSFMPEITE